MSYKKTKLGSVCALVKDPENTLSFITYTLGDDKVTIVEELERECTKRPNEKLNKDNIWKDNLIKNNY